MKAVILYRPNSEHARVVEEYAHDFTRQTDKSIELLDVDSVEGIRLVELYSAMTHPSVLALADDGQLLRLWPGTPLPLMNEVAGYLQQQ